MYRIFHQRIDDRAPPERAAWGPVREYDSILTATGDNPASHKAPPGVPPSPPPVSRSGSDADDAADLGEDEGDVIGWGLFADDDVKPALTPEVHR